MDVRTATPAPAIGTHAAAGAVIRMPAAPTVMNEGSDASGASMDSSMGRSLPEQSREASSESVVATHQPVPNQQNAGFQTRSGTRHGCTELGAQLFTAYGCFGPIVAVTAAPRSHPTTPKSHPALPERVSFR